MTRLLLCALVLAIASATLAGGNPDVRIYIDFDPPNYVHEVYPEQYTNVEAYVCLDHVGEGVTSVSFRMDDPVTACPGVTATSFWYSMFPGGFLCLDPWEDGGAVVQSTDCMADDVVVVGCIILFYLGGSCCLEILDHLDYPRWIADCRGPAEIDHYCVLAHGSVGGADCPQGDCGQVPVDDSTWGTIKSLYR